MTQVKAQLDQVVTINIRFLIERVAIQAYLNQCQGLVPYTPIADYFSSKITIWRRKYARAVNRIYLNISVTLLYGSTRPHTFNAQQSILDRHTRQ